MAENEERIWIEYDIPKPKGAIKSTRSITMTRQEAIDRIAKALCNQEMVGAVGCERCKFAKDKEKCEAWMALIHGGDAKAALDALLSLQSKKVQ